MVRSGAKPEAADLQHELLLSADSRRSRADFGWAKSTHRGRSLRLTLSICLARLFEIQ
jgi:hypothetical protein